MVSQRQQRLSPLNPARAPLTSEDRAPQLPATLLVPQDPRPRAVALDLRPRLRHYFTRASFWNPRSVRRYAAYDPRRHSFADSTTRYLIPGYPGATGADEAIEPRGDYTIPSRGFSSFPPRWMSAPGLRVWVNFQQDVFYFSSAEFPGIEHGRPADRVARAVLRLAAPLGHRERLVGHDDVPSPSSPPSCAPWLGRIEKIAIHAVVVEAAGVLLGVRHRPPLRFALHPADRATISSHMASLRRIYLVVPRDPHCPHGPHRDWLRARPNEDGFLPYADFVRLHGELEGAALGLGGRAGARCGCFVDWNPTDGEVGRLQQAFGYSERPPEVHTVVEDILA